MNPGQVLSGEQLLSGKWGYDVDPGSYEVDVYVRYQRRKLGAERFGPSGSWGTGWARQFSADTSGRRCRGWAGARVGRGRRHSRGRPVARTLSCAATATWVGAVALRGITDGAGSARGAR